MLAVVLRGVGVGLNNLRGVLGGRREVVLLLLLLLLPLSVGSVLCVVGCGRVWRLFEYGAHWLWSLLLE